MADGIQTAYDLARERYGLLGVDTEAALERLARIPISLHCWQGDDVGGFESEEGLTGGGIQATGNYPGKARTADELRGDMEKALSLVPGRHRLNLHAFYGEMGGQVGDRGEIVASGFHFEVIDSQVDGSFTLHRGHLREGRIELVEDVETLRRHAFTRVEVTFADLPSKEAFSGVPGVRELERRGGSSVLFVLEGPADPLVKALARHRVLSLDVHEADLEDIFLSRYRRESPHAA